MCTATPMQQVTAQAFGRQARTVYGTHIHTAYLPPMRATYMSACAASTSRRLRESTPAARRNASRPVTTSRRVAGGEEEGEGGDGGDAEDGEEGEGDGEEEWVEEGAWEWVEEAAA